LIVTPFRYSCPPGPDGDRWLAGCEAFKGEAASFYSEYHGSVMIGKVIDVSFAARIIVLLLWKVS
jgi:hypothetical protein